MKAIGSATASQGKIVAGGYGGPPVEIVGDALWQVLTSRKVWNSRGEKEQIRGEISGASCAKLQQLVALVDARRTLEIGCATGVSALAIVSQLEQLGGDRTHVAIDPNQTSYGPDGYRGVGVETVRRAGLQQRFTLIEKPSHLGLPALLSEGQKFDLIFIDGWHSFDYAFVDYFYSDLLLNDGGILVFDDVGMPPIRHVCWFLETHKPYDFLGGVATLSTMHPWYKATRRWNPANHTWGSVQAYRKRRTAMVPSDFFEAPFYPHYRLYRWWLRLRGLRIRNPYEPGKGN
jgi:predicted O-methyltransferase YrrM